MRAMKIGLEHRIQMKIDTSWKILVWMVELAPTLINRCFVGHDGKTPYARLMGKNSSKNIVKNRRKCWRRCPVEDNARGSKRYRRGGRRQSGGGIAKMWNEHIVVVKWDGKTISGIVATPRKPHPSEPGKKEIGTGATMKFEKRPVPRKRWFAGISGSPTGSWKNMATRQDALVARQHLLAGPGAGENTQMHAATGSRAKCLRTQMRMCGLRNEM